MPATPEIPLSNLMLDELLDVLEEGAIAAQLGRAPSLKVVKDRPADRKGEGGVAAEPRAVESTQEAGLMAGLAEALKEVELTTTSAPDAEDPLTTGLSPAEPARPRFRMAAWRA
jgi:hypothetical protein